MNERQYDKSTSESKFLKHFFFFLCGGEGGLHSQNTSSIQKNQGKVFRDTKIYLRNYSSLPCLQRVNFCFQSQFFCYSVQCPRQTKISVAFLIPGGDKKKKKKKKKKRRKKKEGKKNGEKCQSLVVGYMRKKTVPLFCFVFIHFS